MSSGNVSHHSRPDHHGPLEGAADAVEEAAEAIEPQPWSLTSTQWRLVVPADVVSVGALVVFGDAIGNDGGPGVLMGAVPFGIALLASWTVVQLGWRPLERAWPGGVLVWLGAGGVGLLMRDFLFDQSTTADFCFMALVLLAAFMLGWRVLYQFGRAHDHMTPKAVQRRRENGE